MSFIAHEGRSPSVAIRDQLITHLEEANSECAGERQPFLTFIVAGGEFAGVETLGGINDAEQSI
jgi:NADH dehydrogenase FAD-containing subunit